MGAGYFPMVSSFATEQVQVLTGGFSAEYGEAMGGVVNTVMKTGYTDHYEGQLRWRHDLAALWGSQIAGVKLTRESEGSRLKAVDDGDGAKLQGPNQHQFDFGIGGPIAESILPNTTFYLSAVYMQEEFRDNSYELYDPAGNNLGQLPNDMSWKKNITGRMKFRLTDDIDLIVGGMYGVTNIEYMGSSWLYATDEGVIGTEVVDGETVNITNGIPEYVAKIHVSNQFVSNAMARIIHRLNNNSFYEFTVSHTSNNDESSKRIGDDDPNYFSGFDLWYPQDSYSVSGSELVKNAPGTLGDKVVDQYTKLSSISKSNDGYYDLDKPLVNPLTGYYEGDAYYLGTNNPYGRENAFVVHGNTRTFNFRKGSYWQIDGNYNLLIDRKTNEDFQHSIKAGFELRFFEQHRHNNSLPWDGQPFFDVYTDQWGGNFYVEEEEHEITSKPFKPWKMAGYIQDQITYKGIIISPGLRFDLFNPNADYRTSYETFIPISSDTGFASSTVKMQVSPRINITYPLTDMSNFSLSYGLYFKMPEMQSMYDGFNKEKVRGNDIIGEPNMDVQRTNQYQIAYNQGLTEDIGLSITAYYKDIYNQLGVSYVPALPQPYYQYIVADYGNARGVEFVLHKRAKPYLGDPLSFQINYTLSSVVGTSTSSGSMYGASLDPYTEEIAYPLSEYPMGQDRTHRLNLVTALIWGNGQGLSIGGVPVLENSSISLTGFYISGSPYTKLDSDGRAVGEVNSERQPGYWSADLRFTKRFLLSDFFGDGIGKRTAIEFFFDIYNIFNLNDAVAYYARTGDALDNGSSFDVQVGQFSSTPYYKNANYAIAETIRADQYNNYGERLYSEAADLDLNGIVTQDEKYEAYIKQLENNIKFRGNFQAPRTVYFGFMLRF